ncbi:MAG: hypothetical protein AB1664_10990 [Thermodesulfobacteriota bacterium]
MPGTVGWGQFFSGDYDFFDLSMNSGQWNHAGILRLTFSVNSDWCLRVTISGAGSSSPFSSGFFHLNHTSGTHVSAAAHPNNWFGNSWSSVLDGGVMEGPVGSRNFFRFGYWEVVNGVEGSFAPPGVPVQGLFKGKSYEPDQGVTGEHKLISKWLRPRPDANYPWNV